MNQKINDAVELFNNHLNTYYTKLEKSGSHDKEFCDLMKEQNKYGTKQGRKYTKIISRGGVVAFIDNNTLDVYKPAGWASPAKHVRGNLNIALDSGFNLDSMGIVNVKYLR